MSAAVQPYQAHVTSGRMGLTIVLPLSLMIVARLLLQAGLYRSGFLALTADDYGRVVRAANWAARPVQDWGGVWLPFHTILHGLGLKLHDDMRVTPRLLTIAFGLLSIVLMGQLARTLFSDERIGLISALLLAVNPAHLWLSSAPLAEIPTFTLILGCLVGLGVFLKSRRAPALLASALCLALANGFRFEGWMFSIPFSLFLALRAARLVWVQSHSADRKTGYRQEAAILLITAALPWIIPILWMAASWQMNGNPLAFIEEIRAYKAARFQVGSSYLRYLQTIKLIEPAGALLILPGLALLLAKYRKQAIWYAVFATVPAAIFLALHAGQYDPPANLLRYLAPFIFLGLPLASAALIQGIERLPFPGWPKLALLAILLLGVSVYQTSNAFAYQNDPSSTGFAVGERLQAIRRENPELAETPALLEVRSWEFLAVQVGANETSSIFYDRTPDPFGALTSVLESESAYLQACLAQYKVGLILLRSPEYKAVLPAQLGLHLLDEVNGYNIYIISDPGEAAGADCRLRSGADW